MITSGIIRKIDELGRIVLPKEIRKTLNINTGDDFQITVNEDKIILHKFQKLRNIENEIRKLINSFTSVNNYKIYIVIENREVIENKRIVVNLNTIIQERKLYQKDSIEKIQIVENTIDEGRIVIHPIIKDSDLLGTIVIISKEKIIDLINTSKIINNLIKDILDSK